MIVLDRKFYNRPTVDVARDLLGKRLVRRLDNAELSGIIIETEAYCGADDSACHAHRGRTIRNAVMFGKPGHAYVYFTYGMHYLLNVVTEGENKPCAVLIRAILPLTGLDQMRARRRRQDRDLANGPAKLCQALSIDKSFYGWDLTKRKQLWVEPYRDASPDDVIATPRIGIDYAAGKDRKALRRFLLKPA